MSYPKFISDSPIGEDLFIGKPQEKVAEGIIKYMADNVDGKKRVIGIEGEWGSGKSNVVEIINRKASAKYHVFTFDTWGHQEDLTRRTFLEELTEDLIVSKLLSTEWKIKLKEKLATNRRTTYKANPSFNPVLVIGAVLILMFPWFRLMLEYFLIKCGVEFPGFYALNGAILLVVFLSIGAWIFRDALGIDKTITWGELLYLYQGKEVKTDIHETITQLEPSVGEFRSILNEITNHLLVKKQLVFVFDNMDRLPGNKVREIWSSIHTFFAELRNNNYKAWVLIPYDSDHIENMFDSEHKRELAASYIQKTFSITFRVSPPIMTQWREYLSQKFEEAFGFKDNPDDQIANIYDYLQRDNTVKPRQIIDYINNLVALQQQWKETIPFKYCALFVLRKQVILKNPTSVILEREFLDGAASLFQNDDMLEKYLSALTFNVPINDAEEVLLKRSIERALRGEMPLKDFEDGSAFSKVLESCFFNSEIDCEKFAEALAGLSDKWRIANEFQRYWLTLARRFQQIQFDTHEKAEKVFKIIVINILGFKERKELIAFFIKSTHAKKGEAFRFNGAAFSKQVDEITNFLRHNGIEIDANDFIPDRWVEPNDYIQFVLSAQQPYKDYHTFCEIDKLNNYLNSKLPIEIMDFKEFIEKTKADTDFTNLIEHIKLTLADLSAETSGFELSLPVLLDIARLFDKVKYVTDQMSAQRAFDMIQANQQQACLMDLIFIISIREDKDTFINAGVLPGILHADNNQKAREVFEFYLSYGDLILLAVDYPFPLFKSVLRNVTQEPYKNSHLNIGKILQRYDAIKRTVWDNSSEYLEVFLNRLDVWETDFKQLVEGHQLRAVVPFSFIEDYKRLQNVLSKTIKVEVLDYLETASMEEWQTAFENSDSDYLFRLLKHVLDWYPDELSQLSENATEGYKIAIMTIVSNGSYPNDVLLWNKILFRLRKNLMRTQFKNIRDRLIFSQDFPNEQSLLFLREGLFLYGHLDDPKMAEDVVRKLIFPSLKTEAYWDNLSDNDFRFIGTLILSVPNLYEEAKSEIQKAGETRVQQLAPLLREIEDYLGSSARSESEDGNPQL